MINRGDSTDKNLVGSTIKNEYFYSCFWAPQLRAS
jgi:hypothetical protein